jgi:hypothetical protein
VSSSKLLFSFVAVPLLALLIACGGDKKDDSGSSGNGDSSSSSSQSSGSGASGDDRDSSSSSSDTDVSLENCKQYASFAAAATSAFGASSGSAKIDKNALNNLVKQSPKEIKSDMQVIVDTFVTYLEALDKIGVNLNDPSSIAKLDQTKLQQMQAATEKLDTDKFQNALDKVDAFFTKECS